MPASAAAAAKAPPNIPAAKARLPAAAIATPSSPPPPSYTSEEVPPNQSLPAGSGDVPMSSGADVPAADMEVEAADTNEASPFGGIKIQALRPTIHPPQPRSSRRKSKGLASLGRPSFSYLLKPFVLFLLCFLALAI